MGRYDFFYFMLCSAYLCYGKIYKYGFTSRGPVGLEERMSDARRSAGTKLYLVGLIEHEHAYEVEGRFKRKMNDTYGVPGKKLPRSGIRSEWRQVNPRTNIQRDFTIAAHIARRTQGNYAVRMWPYLLPKVQECWASKTIAGESLSDSEKARIERGHRSDPHMGWCIPKYYYTSEAE
jgi:hypothetical protein